MRRSIAVLLFIPVPALATHSLITEDTGTQGVARFQIELLLEQGRDQRSDGELYDTHSTAVLSYGVSDNLDAILSVGYRRLDIGGGDSAVREGGGDVGLDLKWRYYEVGRWSLAVKPGMTLPSGDEEDGLGTGEATYSVFNVTTYAPDPWAFHLHLGYIRYNNRLGLRENRGHLSVAAVREFSRWSAVADMGVTTDPDRATAREPAFLILGAIVPVAADVHLDLGIKLGLTETETDETLLAGVAARF